MYYDKEQKALQELLVIQSQIAYISQFLSNDNMESTMTSPSELIQSEAPQLSYEQQLQDFAQQLKELDQRQKEDLFQQSQFQENQEDSVDHSPWRYSEGHYCDENYNNSLSNEYSISETPPYFLDTDESSCHSDSMEEVPV